jgi:uncharacterized protein (TIGR03067 family)
MKATLLLALTAGLALPAHAAQKKEAGGDHEKIQGTWEVISFEQRGEKDSAEDIKGLQAQITKDKIAFTRGGKPAGASTYKLDPTRKPRWITFTPIKGDDKRRLPAMGIYELTGDSLKLCFAPGDGDDQRPTAFETKRDSNHHVLMVLKRKKP